MLTFKLREIAAFSVNISLNHIHILIKSISSFLSSKMVHVFCADFQEILNFKGIYDPYFSRRINQKFYPWASLVAQWLRVCLPVQGTRVRALVWEDPTCHGATGPVSHNY